MRVAAVTQRHAAYDPTLQSASPLSLCGELTAAQSLRLSSAIVPVPARRRLSSAKQGSRSIRRATVERVAIQLGAPLGQPHPQLQHPCPRPASSPPVNIEAKFTLPWTFTVSRHPPSLLLMSHLSRPPRLLQASS
jgi:hypothetical protein